jgi:hypothetical protein
VNEAETTWNTKVSSFRTVGGVEFDFGSGISNDAMSFQFHSTRNWYRLDTHKVLSCAECPPLQ